MAEAAYPVDYTGVGVANLVLDETHTLTEINDTTYRFIIPKFAPFYLSNFKVKHVDENGTVVELVEHVDYDLCLPYLGATRSIGQVVYGGIVIFKDFVNGLIKIDYQCVGGKWCADPDYVLWFLAEKAYNPRVVVWDLVTNVQETFPPINHEVQLDELKGTEEVVESLNKIEQAILQPKPTPANEQYLTHITNFDNPHMVTKDQVGLAAVEDLPIASDTELLSRQIVRKYITLGQAVNLIKDMMEAGHEQPDIQKLYTEVDTLKAKLNVLDEVSDASDVVNKLRQIQSVAEQLDDNLAQQLLDVKRENSLLKTDFDNLYTSVNTTVASLRTDIESKAAVPIGSVYVQYPGKKAPSEIYTGVWTNVSDEYAGDFFRAEGGLGATWGVRQMSALPNITGASQVEAHANMNNRGIGALYNIPSHNYQGIVTTSNEINCLTHIHFDASRSNSIYQNVSEARVQNKAIRIWERTA